MTSIVPGRGWYLEVDHPDGNVWRPDVVGEPTPQPTINGLPRLSVPVRASDRYAKGDFDGQPMRAWFNGVRLPVDQVDTPRATERGWVLEGRGAVELNERVRMEVDSRPAHLVADDIIGQTPYTADIDAPASALSEQLVQSADSQSEWQDTLPSFPSTSPLTVTSGGSLTTQQSLYFSEGEDYDTEIGTQVISDSNASNGEYVEFVGSSNGAKWNFTTEYDISAGDVGVAVLYDVPSSSDTTGDFDLLLNGTRVGGILNGSLNSGRWWGQYEGDYGASLSAGNHTVEVDMLESGDPWGVDAVALYDARQSYDFPTAVDSNGYLPGPQTHPLQGVVATDDVSVADSVVGGRIASTWDDLSNQQFVAVSNDQGATYKTAQNSDSIDTSFDDAGTTIRAQFGLSRYGSRTTQSPTTGFKSQSIDLYELYAEVDNTPLVVNQTFDDDATTVLNRIAPPGTVWQAVRDGDSYRVIWTEAGQRTTDTEDDVSNWEYERRVEQAVDKVVIKGSVLRRRDERVTAQHDTAVPLDEDELVHGRESVYDPSSSDEFVEGQDYRLNAQPGELVALSSGNISDGQEVAIDYGYRPVGESETSVSDPHTIVRSITGLTSDRECELIAMQLASELDTPVTEGTVTLSADRTDWSLVESRAFAALPTAEQVDIHDAQPSASGTDLRIGSRQPLEEIIDDIRNRVSQNAERS
ncbi:hypothetical protein [Haloarcula argentinensis]|uniref:CBM6 domain-containing protein n=1 Tax=Haloarcula argentinensis TaxID=43776 RepID=A0ABU2F623_HALAR|nr:hypothetical protein [Haloarcula argentinensis]MDS0256019.1 hypothetical protein [Haloarcula argentinensis]